jgi:hypothetical protein
VNDKQIHLLIRTNHCKLRFCKHPPTQPSAQSACIRVLPFPLIQRTFISRKS